MFNVNDVNKLLNVVIQLYYLYFRYCIKHLNIGVWIFFVLFSPRLIRVYNKSILVIIKFRYYVHGNIIIAVSWVNQLNELTAKII